MSSFLSKLPILPVLVSADRLNRPIALVLGNKIDDVPSKPRVISFAKNLHRAGFDVYILPAMVLSALDAQLKKEFHSMIAQEIDLLVSVGGEDIDPSFYGESIKHCMSTNPARDSEELEIVKSFKEFKKGIFLGICRGHQLGAIVDGHQLYQDIEKEGIGLATTHLNPLGTTADSMQTFHEVIWQDSDFIGLASTWVNSVHHQAVRLRPGGSSTPVGLAPDGIIEALLDNNQLGFSVQFHPEMSVETALPTANGYSESHHFVKVQNIIFDKVYQLYKKTKI